MVDQILTKPIGLIWDLKIHIHSISYIVTFIVMKNNVLNANYSMLLGHPWLQKAKVTHDWGNNFINIEGNNIVCVATLALGPRPRQRIARLWAKREAWGSHLMFLGVQKSAREWTFTLPSEFPFWELESQWTLEFSKGECRGQNPLDWKVFYIIEKLLKCRCLKWARMTHLDIWNTSYGQKKGRESNWQFDSWLLKVGNRPDFLVFRWRATYRWKALNEG
jgi:hypothetical protein